MKTLSRYVSSRVGNGGSPRAFAANVIYKATADIVSKCVTLVVTIAAARVLPAADFGVLAVAMTTGWILSVASDAGLPLYLAKRMAELTSAGMPASLATIAGVMRVRAAFAIIAAIAGLVIGALVAPGGLLIAFVLIVAAQLLNAVLETLAHAYRGIGRTDIESSVIITQRSLTAIAVVATLVMSPSLRSVALALFIPPAIALGASWWIARGVAKATAAHTGANSLSRDRFMREAAPIGLGILLSALYFRCDIYFLQWWAGLETVGIYNAAFRIVEALRLFPAAVLAVAFPALCTAGDGRPLKRLLVMLGSAGAATAVAVYAAAPVILGVLYGERFLEGVNALQILGLAVPLFFLNYALTHQVIGWNGQRLYLAIAGIALFANIIANTVLIPSAGMVGAAFATLLTEITVTAGCGIALRRTMRNLALAGSMA